MSNEQSQKPHSLDCQFADQFKREARAERPAFSPTLHNRVMAAIVASDALPAVNEMLSVGRKRRPLRRAIQWAAIAAAILIAIFAIDQFRRGGNSADIVPREHSTAGIVKISPPADELSFDDLNRTAGIALRFMADQLPIDVHADDWGLPALN
ncbi:MAG TPA: hypothetical protein VKB78_17075 [Pirellulales bacterium]|nr:hypothetical protein [Pirellulales bacterium]